MSNESSSREVSNGVLCITEKWIREHLNLQRDSLDNVRSVSLPGSYYEKITHLGRSLNGFIRLKHLDLSRNALESLEGLDHLKHLESLNIYYNNIDSLTELFKLRHCKKLKVLDVRLNPVTKNEPDYRLFMVHMLTSLRKLDDRGVRDTERRAALMHFSSAQAHLFEKTTPLASTPVSVTKQDKHLSSRKQLVQSLAPHPNCLDEDTDELLDLIARSDKENHTPSPPSYHHSPPTHSGRKLTHTPHSSRLNERGERDDSLSDSVLDDLLGFMQWFVDGDLSVLKQDSEFKDKFGDWVRAHLPPPPSHPHTPPPTHPHTPLATREEKLKLEETIKDLQKQLHNVTETLQQQSKENTLLKTQLKQSHSDCDLLTQQLEERNVELSQEMTSRQHTRIELQQQLERASQEAISLRNKVSTLTQDNTSLTAMLSQTPPISRVEALQQQIRSLEEERDELRTKLVGVTEEGVVNNTTQQLVVMLQESHESLMSTNSRLIAELDEMKASHSEHVSQLTHNYDTLRHTLHHLHSTHTST